MFLNRNSMSDRVEALEKRLEKRIADLEARVHVLGNRTAIVPANASFDPWNSIYGQLVSNDVPIDDAVKALARHVGVEFHYRSATPSGVEVKPVNVVKKKI